MVNKILKFGRIVGLVVCVLLVINYIFNILVPNTPTPKKRDLNFNNIVVDGIKIDTFSIKNGTFNYESFILLCEDTNVVKKITGWERIDYSVGITDENFVWISNPYNKGLVAHEIVHLAWNTLIESGVPINADTEEVLAYEVSRITNEFYNKFYGKK